MRARLLLALAALLLTPVAACSDDDGGGSSGNGDRQAAEFRMGALLPITGALSSYGEASRAALEEAQTKVNAENAQKAALTVLDTSSEPATALAKLQELHAAGIKLVIGPYSSSEVQAVKAFADQNGIILVSPLSTATSLAVPNDNIFRYTPDDNEEGAALAALAYADGIRTLIPVSRNDPGNLGLQSSVKQHFERLGGRIGPGITYATNETAFAPVALELTNILQAQQPASTGVYLTAFAEVTMLLGAAADTPGAATLKAVNWYGSDSVALSKGLAEDRKAAAFSVEVGYPNPILGLRTEDESRWKPVSDALTRKLNRTPDSFALAAYDGFIVGYSALKTAGAGAGGAALGQAFVQASSTHTGLTGPTNLNPAGDRASGSYDFWSICPSGSTYTWVRTATYTAAVANTPAKAQQVRGC